MNVNISKLSAGAEPGKKRSIKLGGWRSVGRNNARPRAHQHRIGSHRRRHVSRPMSSSRPPCRKSLVPARAISPIAFDDRNVAVVEGVSSNLPALSGTGHGPVKRIRDLCVV
jgi:hypothetical protein